MPRSKTSPRRGRSSLGQEKYTAELSSGQLVIGVVILLMFGLACFLLGVLIGKFDPSLQPRVAQQASPSDNSETADANRMATANPPQRTADRTPPARRDIPPTPSQSEPAVVGKQAPIQGTSLVPKQAEDATDEPDAPPAAEASEPVNEPPASKPEIDVAEAPAEPEEPAQPEPAPAPPRVEEVYAVQIHAFRPSARPRAENAARDFAARSNYETFLVPSDNGQWLRVFAGKFADRAAAARARDEIRRQYGELSKCFVPASPIRVPRT